MDPQTVSTLFGTWGYPALLLLLVLTGLGSPIPEDLLLFTAGYLVFSGVFSWPPAMAIGLVGVVASDLILYYAGRQLAWHSTRWPRHRLRPRERLAAATEWFGRLGDRLIFVARLVPGTRAVVFLTAGARGVPVGSFLRYDVLGAMLWVPAMLIAGYAAGSSIGDLDDAIAALNRGAVWVLAIAVALLLVWLLWGREESKL